MYFTVLSAVGPQVLAVTTSLSINFLKKPGIGELVIETKMLKLGKRLVVGEVFVFNDGERDPVSHATVTCSIPGEVLLRMACVVGMLAAVGCERGVDAAAFLKAPPAAAPTAVAAEPPTQAAVAPQAQAVEAPPNAECATGEACSAAALALERDGDAKRAVPLYTRACDLGHGSACHRLGELYRDGKGVAPDDGQARTFFERGCQADSTAACDALGH